MIPAGSTAVMARRHEPPDSLDFFPTPPWATRALMRHVLPALGDALPPMASVADPAAGEGHMAEVLREFVPDVRASDVFDYGVGYPVVDFLDARRDFAPVDLLCTNPPFNAALAFGMRALRVAQVVAFFLPPRFYHGDDRYTELLRDHPPTLYAPFVERVACLRGRWVPDASTATDYAWFVWVRGAARLPPFQIPPGRKRALSLPSDAPRFAWRGPLPLFVASDTIR